VDEHAPIALGGADLGTSANGTSLPLWRPVSIPAGVAVGSACAVRGCRGYLAVAGGFDVPMVLGSRATYVRAALGGVDGHAVRRGDVLPVGAMPELAHAILARVMASSGRDRVTVAPWGGGAALLPCSTS